jgi:hypothetical protein
MMERMEEMEMRKDEDRMRSDVHCTTDNKGKTEGK